VLCKSCVNIISHSQNTPPFFIYKKKKCNDLGVGQNLTKFAKISMPESLKFFLNFVKNKK
jgi:hypothetical protein